MLRDIEFNRPAKYQFREVLGSGACGETVLLFDEAMGADFVAKKYSPIVEAEQNQSLYDELLRRFKDEARILFRLDHPNVVRVFSFFDYAERSTSYILMEYVDGVELLKFLDANPFAADRVFEGIVEGFSHLQAKGVLHRDIRPANIMVQADGVPKIIDFGFGKTEALEKKSDDRKSISLNWWCETPPEFADSIYDFQTEVYFVGKLFEQALSDGKLSDFKYKLLVGRMCDPNRDRRIEDFQSIQSEISRGKFAELSFSDDEVRIYRNFADELTGVVSSVQSDSRFERDVEKIIVRLEELHRRSMLEEFLPAPNKLAQAFIMGPFKYWTKSKPAVASLKEFLGLLRGLSSEKKAVIVENLTARLEASERTVPPPDNLDDEIPF